MELTKIENIGLSNSFQNWQSTLVDTINEDLEVIETSIGSGLHLTRVDTSAVSNIELSDSFKEWLDNLVDVINELRQLIEAKGK